MDTLVRNVSSAASDKVTSMAGECHRHLHYTSDAYTTHTVNTCDAYTTRKQV